MASPVEPVGPRGVGKTPALKPLGRGTRRRDGAAPGHDRAKPSKGDVDDPGQGRKGRHIDERI